MSPITTVDNRRPSSSSAVGSCSRRSFLSKGVSLAGAGGLALLAAGQTACTAEAQAGQPAAPPAPARRELGIYVSPKDPKLAEKLAWLASQEVRHIGLERSSLRKADELQGVARIIQQAGMKPVAVHGSGALAHPDNDQRALQARHMADLEQAVAWGAEQIVVHFRSLATSRGEGYWFGESSYITEVGLETYDSRVVELLAWLCAEAAKHQVRIAVENLPIQHAFAYRVEEIVAMIGRIAAPNLGICLDAGHANASGLDVAAAIRAAGKHLITTHLHDNLGGGDPRRPTPKTDLHWCVGLGTINWPSVIHALDAIGYRGPAVFEGTRIGPKSQMESDWHRGASMAIANWRAWESLAAEVTGDY